MATKRKGGGASAAVLLEQLTPSTAALAVVFARGCRSRLAWAWGETREPLASFALPGCLFHAPIRVVTPTVHSAVGGQRVWRGRGPAAPSTAVLPPVLGQGAPAARSLRARLVPPGRGDALPSREQAVGVRAAATATAWLGQRPPSSLIRPPPPSSFYSLFSPLQIIPPTEYADLQLSTSGEVQGVGLLVATDPTAGGRLVVVAPVAGGPAARAGVEPGDTVLEIDDRPAPADSTAAAALLRGAAGSKVTLRVARVESGGGTVPGVARRAPTAPATTSISVRTFALQREAVDLSPVSASLIALPGSAGSAGYIRLTSFTSRSEADVAAALAGLSADGARAFVLDLRGNPGGLVRAAMGVAHLWLPPGAPVFNVVGRDDTISERVVLGGGEWDEAAPPASSSLSLSTYPPLAVLVDHNSASAAEILAGALRDNGRAAVLGDRTFGKGKIQQVVSLGGDEEEDSTGWRRWLPHLAPDEPATSSAGALSLTVARYTTPSGAPIDGQGLRPTRACRAGRLPPAVPGAPAALASALEADACLKVAAGVLAAQL